MIERGKEKSTRRLAIVGAGAAGISTAICAAKHGLQADLFEREDHAGGTVVNGLLHTLAGFMDGDGQIIDSPICREFYERASAHASKRKIGKLWVLQMDYTDYASMTGAWLREFPQIRLRTSATTKAVQTSGSSITGVTFSIGNKKFQVDGDRTDFVDATGDAAFASMVKPGLVTPAEEHSFAICLRVESEQEMNLSPIGRIALKAKLESELAGKASVWIDSGTHTREVFVKLGFDGPDGVRAVCNQTSLALGQHPRLAPVRKITTGALCDRMGGQLKAFATKTDNEHSFLVSWPYEIWQGSQVELSSPPHMPFRLSEGYLKSSEIHNLFAAGKSAGIPMPYISAARVVGGCWTMGEQLVKLLTRGAL